jgi:hypothetical protein
MHSDDTAFSCVYVAINMITTHFEYLLVDSQSAVILRSKAPHQQRQLEHVVEGNPVLQ